MTPTCEDVIEAYRLFLGRDPESAAVIDLHRASHASVPALIKSLLGSPEGQRANGLTVGRPDLTEYTGVTADDLAMLQRFHVASHPQPGFFIDFVGSRTDVAYVTHTLGMSGVVEGVPITNSIHAETIEWVGTLKAVERAAKNNKFVVAELGAGWGPWVIASAVAARRKGIADIRLIAVEGDPGHYGYLVKHVADNGFEPSQHRLLQGVVAAADGTAYFPDIDSQSDWGAVARFDAEAATVRAGTKTKLDGRTYTTYPAYSLARIIGSDTVDLCHIDIQGSEAEVVAADADVLKKQARWMVIGTHARYIEGRLIEQLSSQGWQLENEKPCKFHNHGFQAYLDGAQVWRNTALT